MEFRWNDWNVEHASRHGVSPEEAEQVVRRAASPYPIRRDDDKWLVWGRGRGGRLLQVVYILDAPDRVFVIHTRPLNQREKHRWRRRKRRRR